MKTILYKLFGVGKVREPLLSELKNEDVLSWDEGIKSLITYKNFRSKPKILCFLNSSRIFFSKILPARSNGAAARRTRKSMMIGFK